MSSHHSRERRTYALRSDQTCSAERRVEWSQVYTDKIVAPVRELYRKWQEVCGAGADTFEMQQHSRNIQLAIAEIMIQKKWTTSVANAVRSIMGNGQVAFLNIESGRQYAERQCAQRETNQAPAVEEGAPAPQDLQYA